MARSPSLFPVFLPVCLLALFAPGVALADLSKREQKELKAKIASAASQEDWKAARESMTRLAGADDPKVWAFLVKVLERAPRWFAREEVEGLAALQRSPKAQREVEKSARKAKSKEVRRGLLLHLAREQRWEVVIQGLDDKAPEVAEAAAWLIADERVEAGVAPLLERLTKSKRDPALEPVFDHALGALLGGRRVDAAAYAEAWSALKGKGGLKAAKVEVPKWPEVESPRVVVVLDVSGSMSLVDKSQKAAGGQLRSRLERARSALDAVLSTLPETTRVNVVVYASHVKGWRGREGEDPPRLWPLGEKTRKDVRDFVGLFKAEGVSDLERALVYAAEIEGTRAIYLVSGGFPTRDGRTPVPTENFEKLLENYRSLRRIHALGFAESDQTVAKLLAKKTGGHYVELD